jgi:hypothetical protein
MRFTLTDEQTGFAEALDGLLGSSDVPRTARAWADGDHDAGSKLGSRLGDMGLNELATEATPVELCIAFEALGRYAVPGPWVESAAYLPIALGRNLADTWATVAVPPHVPYALDADIVADVYVAVDGELRRATADDAVASVDSTRRLCPVTPGELVEHGDLDAAFDLAVLAVSAQLLGAGERLLADSVTYAKQRKQFGREIGSYQAIKHQLADVRIALDFSRPLIHGAALTISGPDGSRDVSAAKVAASDAAYLASRVALQVHGAIGYTQEFDLSLWITKVRALVGAWGTPAYHRGRVLDALLSAGSGNGG